MSRGLPSLHRGGYAYACDGREEADGPASSESASGTRTRRRRDAGQEPHRRATPRRREQGVEGTLGEDQEARQLNASGVSEVLSGMDQLLPMHGLRLAGKRTPHE